MLGRLQRLENGGRRVHLPQESQATEGSKARLAVEGGRNRGETKFDIVKACAIYFYILLAQTMHMRVLSRRSGFNKSIIGSLAFATRWMG